MELTTPNSQEPKMTSKRTLKHLTESGVLDTRTTAADYTHVVVFCGTVQDESTDAEIREGLVKMNWEGDALEARVATIIQARDERNANPQFVTLSWHGSEQAAAKAARKADGYYRNVKVEAVNGGERS